MAVTIAAWLLCAFPLRGEEHVEADLLIVGGTESGCAAAVQAARMGVKRIVLVNDIEWLGGQFSAEAVCSIDENRGVNQTVPFSRTGLFKEVMDRIESFNQKKYGHKNPGNAWTSLTTCRPSEVEAVFRQLIQPYVESGQVRVIGGYYPTGVQIDDKSQVEVGDGRLTVEIGLQGSKTNTCLNWLRIVRKNK